MALQKKRDFKWSSSAWHWKLAKCSHNHTNWKWTFNQARKQTKWIFVNYTLRFEEIIFVQRPELAKKKLCRVKMHRGQAIYVDLFSIYLTFFLSQHFSSINRPAIENEAIFWGWCVYVFLLLLFFFSEQDAQQTEIELVCEKGNELNQPAWTLLKWNFGCQTPTDVVACLVVNQLVFFFVFFVYWTSVA